MPRFGLGRADVSECAKITDAQTRASELSPCERRRAIRPAGLYTRTPDRGHLGHLGHSQSAALALRGRRRPSCRRSPLHDGPTATAILLAAREPGLIKCLPASWVFAHRPSSNLATRSARAQEQQIYGHARTFEVDALLRMRCNPATW